MFENKLAIELRKKWNISPIDSINIFNLIQNKISNLTLVWMPMENNMWGCCSKNNIHSVILLNSNHSKGRQNFTLAHEVYHLLYDKQSIYFCNKNEYNESENKANNFASSLLMPDEALKTYITINNIEKWNLVDIIKCEQYFQINRDALLHRLLINNYIDNIEYDNFSKNIKLEAMKLGFNSDLYEPNPENKKYYTEGELIQLTEKTYNDDKITQGLHNEILLYASRLDLIYIVKEGYKFE